MIFPITHHLLPYSMSPGLILLSVSFVFNKRIQYGSCQKDNQWAETILTDLPDMLAKTC